MSKSRRRWIPRSFKLLPAAVISAIVVAVLSLLGLLNIQLPSVQQSKESSPTDSASDTPRFVTSESPDEPTTPRIDQPPADQAAAQREPGEAASPPKLVEVLIDGDRYLVRLVGEGSPSGAEGETSEVAPLRQRLSLEDIVALARELPGDSSGVRVRISRTFNATARADRALGEALRQAGLSEDEIDHRRTLVN